MSNPPGKPDSDLRSRLTALLPGANREKAPFIDGLMLGAVVGAAIAGSTLWTRWRARRNATLAATVTAVEDSPPG